jgi:tetratricopeptide (TPR) repeat protein
MSAQPTPVEVFLSYAEADEPLCLELEKHLSVLKREGMVSTWHKGQIGVGTDKTEETDRRLSTASIIVLLLSANFVASDYCYSVEMEQAIARHDGKEAYVIPVVLRPMDNWHNTPFGKLQALPRNGEPVTSWLDPDAAFADIAKGIRSVVQHGKLPPAVTLPPMLPSVWNIPFSRNPFFTGRDELLSHLSMALKTGQATELSQPQTISGLGGIGKTQIAVEFAYRHRHEYQTVLWTLADTRESLISGYLAIAASLNLPEKNAKEQEIMIGAVKTWLQTHGSWLLILDNADDLALAYGFLPPIFGGHLLITTRAQATGTWAKRIEVETMLLEMGTLFLLRRAKLIAQDGQFADVASADVTIARSICEELGGLPLALDQAGAYIEETQCGLLQYLERYRDQRTVLLERRGGVVSDHPAPVATTWSLSFQKVEQQSPDAADLLRLCAFLHPDAIPEEMITNSAMHPDRLQDDKKERKKGDLFSPLITLLQKKQRNVAGTKDRFMLDDAIAVLGAYSLISRNVEEKTLSIHRLVQAVLKDAMDEDMRRQWVKRAVLAVNYVFPDVSFATWPQCERYLSHALVCADLVESEQINSKEAARLLNEAGYYLDSRARYAEAEPLYVNALAIRVQQLGGNHPSTANSFNNLAGLYQAQGKYSEAESLLSRALSIREQQLGDHHPSTATSLNDLAHLYWDQRKYSEAEPLYRQALAIYEEQLGKDHPSTATSLNNLASLYQAQGKFAEAERLYIRALGIRKHKLGADHPDTAQSLNNLAGLYQGQEKFAEAEQLYRQALAIDEKQLGKDHPSTATSLNNLASLYQAQGKFAEAESLYVRVLAIHEQQLGGDHPDTVQSFNNLADLYQAQGKHTEAEQLYVRALSVCNINLRPPKPFSRSQLRSQLPLARPRGSRPETELRQSVMVVHPMSKPWNPCLISVICFLVVILSAGIFIRPLYKVSNQGEAAYDTQVGGDQADSWQHPPNTKIVPQSGPYVVLGNPSITTDFINQVLSTYKSPAAGKGQALYDLGVQYSIDPAFALAFFMHESTFGTQGEATKSLSLGNLRCIPNFRCTDNFAQFDTWEDGFKAWYQLIRNLYVAQWGLTTVDQIIPRYAPQADDYNKQAYIAAIKHALDIWHAGQTLAR